MPYILLCPLVRTESFMARPMFPLIFNFPCMKAFCCNSTTRQERLRVRWKWGEASFQEIINFHHFGGYQATAACYHAIHTFLPGWACQRRFQPCHHHLMLWCNQPFLLLPVADYSVINNRWFKERTHLFNGSIAALEVDCPALGSSTRTASHLKAIDTTDLHMQSATISLERTSSKDTYLFHGFTTHRLHTLCHIRKDDIGLEGRARWRGSGVTTTWWRAASRGDWGRQSRISSYHRAIEWSFHTHSSLPHWRERLHCDPWTCKWKLPKEKVRARFRGTGSCGSDVPGHPQPSTSLWQESLRERRACDI